MSVKGAMEHVTSRVLALCGRNGKKKVAEMPLGKDPLAVTGETPKGSARQEIFIREYFKDRNPKKSRNRRGLESWSLGLTLLSRPMRCFTHNFG